MQRVFVLDKNQNPLMPCHSSRARELLTKKKAIVFKHFPFTIILKNRDQGITQTVELKLDPGSKTTGISLVGHFKRGKRIIFAANLHHRGDVIKSLLEKRRHLRRSRRQRHTRYRAPRFLNRFKAKGTLPPSLKSRVENVKNWGIKIARLCCVKAVAIETVRFDMQKIQNPEISGIEYQQGELLGYEIREYLLEKWQRTCAYCGKINIPFEIEHIIPRSRGGSNRLSNLTLSCRSCNLGKGDQLLEEWLISSKTKSKSKLNTKIIESIKTQAKKPLKDAAAVNSTRYAIGNELKKIFPFVTFWSGGRTKKNRVTQNYRKDHWIDAACVGESGDNIFIDHFHADKFIPLIITAESRGGRQMCRVDKFGFPRTKSKTLKRIYGFQTGDLVKAVVTKGKKSGIYFGRVAIRTSGFFNIKTKLGISQGINYSFCKLIQRVDGYSYTFGSAKVLPMQKHRSSPEGISFPLRPEGRSLQEISR